MPVEERRLSRAARANHHGERHSVQAFSLFPDAGVENGLQVRFWTAHRGPTGVRLAEYLRIAEHPSTDLP